MDWNTITENISASIGREFVLDTNSSVGGGCINSAVQITGSGQKYMVKLNNASLLDMFEAEADGLKELASANSLRVPQAICTGTSEAQAYIVMEYIGMAGSGSMHEFGQQLAQMHRKTHEQFGWHRDNTIGSTPQVNDYESEWLAFYAEHRLGYQLNLARRNGFPSSAFKKGQTLQNELGRFFETYTPEASLLHGDLWSGNYGFSDEGEAVIYDPAVYYGDREADLAMTELFGGFGRDFYAGYDEAWPVDSGYEDRKTLYNLYHILNHFNLFGGGYGTQAASMIDRLLSVSK